MILFKAIAKPRQIVVGYHREDTRFYLISNKPVDSQHPDYLKVFAVLLKYVNFLNSLTEEEKECFVLKKDYLRKS